MNLTFHFGDPGDPIAQFVFLLAIGALSLCLRRYRIGSVFCTLAVVWILLCATPAFAGFLRSGLVSAYAPRAAADYPKADAIVVLGGGDPPAFACPKGKEQSNRTGFALELFRAGRAPVILLSGGDGEAAEMAEQLGLQGVPATELRVESDSASTHQNAALSAAILHKENRQRILLVTSVVPMARASASFRRQGFEVTAVPIFDIYGQPVGSSSWLPQSGILFTSRRYLHEYIGMLIYKLRGWS